MSGICHDGFVAFWTEDSLIEGITLVFVQGYCQNGLASQHDRLWHPGPGKRNRIPNRLPKLIDPHTASPPLEQCSLRHRTEEAGLKAPATTTYNPAYDTKQTPQKTVWIHLTQPRLITLATSLYHLVHKVLIRRHIRPHALTRKDRRICGN